MDVHCRCSQCYKRTAVISSVSGFIDVSVRVKLCGCDCGCDCDCGFSHGCDLTRRSYRDSTGNWGGDGSLGRARDNIKMNV